MVKDKKFSQFNIRIPCKNGILVYNTLSQVLMEIDRETLKKIKDNKLSEEEKEVLEKNFIIVDSDRDEYKVFKKYQISVVQEDKSNSLTLVVATTPLCNFHCSYCFEKDRLFSQSGFEEDKIFETIKYLAKKSGCKKIYITWFGGEPLIQYKGILNLSKKLIDFCEKKHLIFESGMVTNGALISEEKIKSLKVLGLSSIQVTLDGLERTYCELKGCDERDYNQVINNIIVASQFLKVRLRVNCTKQNKKDVYALINKFRNNENLSIIFAPVIDYSGTQKSLYRNKMCFMRDRLRYIKFAYQEGITLDLFRDGLRSSIVPCGLYKTNNFCLDNMGNLYKCEHDIFDKRKIVDKNDISSYNKEVLSKLESDRKSCKRCSLYPICHNGCIGDTSEIKARDCRLFKKYVEEYLAYFSKNL